MGELSYNWTTRNGFETVKKKSLLYAHIFAKTLKFCKFHVVVVVVVGGFRGVWERNVLKCAPNMQHNNF